MTDVIAACKRPLLTSTEQVSCHPAFGPLPSPLDLGPVHASATLLRSTPHRPTRCSCRVSRRCIKPDTDLPSGCNVLARVPLVSTIRSCGNAWVQWDDELLYPTRRVFISPYRLDALRPRYTHPCDGVHLIGRTRRLLGTTTSGDSPYMFRIVPASRRLQLSNTEIELTDQMPPAWYMLKHFRQ